MAKSHLKRLNAPKSWPIERKSTKWVSKPRPGGQKLIRTISINTIMKELLKVVNTSKEVKLSLNKGLIKVDGIVRKDIHFPVSVMDVISIKEDNYRLLINSKGKLFLNPLKKTDAKLKPKKIIGKKVLKGKKLQLNFIDGTNLISKDSKLKVSDTILFDQNKEKESLNFEKGVLVYLIEGNQIGKVGVLKEILPKNGVQPTQIKFQIGKENHTTLKDYAIVVGKTKPLIDMPNE
tara:strand:+ start:1803 stop:2504 length:702 start_codon:yes stop_codon:yes gene_type:complete